MNHTSDVNFKVFHVYVSFYSRQTFNKHALGTCLFNLWNCADHFFTIRFRRRCVTLRFYHINRFSNARIKLKKNQSSECEGMVFGKKMTNFPIVVLHLCSYIALQIWVNVRGSKHFQGKMSWKLAKVFQTISIPIKIIGCCSIKIILEIS